jgi:hypothetical protein
MATTVDFPDLLDGGNRSRPVQRVHNKKPNSTSSTRDIKQHFSIDNHKRKKISTNRANHKESSEDATNGSPKDVMDKLLSGHSDNSKSPRSNTMSHNKVKPSKKDFIEGVNYGQNSPQSLYANQRTLNQKPLTPRSQPQKPTRIDHGSDHTSKTSVSDFSPKEVVNSLDLVINHDDASDVSSLQQSLDDGTNKEGSVSSNASSQKSLSEDARELLERAQDRLARQRLQDEIRELKDVIERKNLELETMAGQLRRAVETKCDLVIAHKELEKSCSNAMRQKDLNIQEMKKANICLMEAKSQTEQQLMSEIIRLTHLCRDLEMKHQEELDDWERMHRNEMLEKDFEIAQLSEELRRLKQASSDSSKKDSGILSMFFSQ